MSHRAIIVCDLCRAEQPTKGGPYPGDWLLVITHKHNGPQHIKKDIDMCPQCVRAFNTMLDQRGGAGE